MPNDGLPHCVQRRGGMVASATDWDAEEWTRIIAAGLRTAMPPERLTETIITDESFVTSVHVRDVDIALQKVRGRFRTDVVHLVFEFEATPSRRSQPSRKPRKIRKRS